MDIPSTWGQAVPAGATSRTINIFIVNDSIAESDETITFTLTDSGITHSGTGRSTWTAGTPNSVTVEILANDGQAISIATDADTIAEDGGNVTFTVTMVGETPASAVTVDWAVSGAGIAAGDYTVSGADTDGTLSFAAAGAQTLVFAVTDDSDSEGDETLTVTLSNPSGGATLGTASASTVIEDNDAVRTLTVTGPAGGSITEGAAGTFNIGITGTAFTSPTAVTWTVTHAQTGGTSDADFGGMAGLTGSVTFPTQTSFTITPAADNLDEADTEAFTVQVSVANPAADMGTAIGTAASVSITDNDMAGLVIAPSALNVPEGGEATYTVRLATQPTAGTVTVTVSGPGDGNTAINAVSETLTFTAANWNSPRTVTVTAAMDAMVDDTATLTHTVTGTGEYASITVPPFMVTIVARATAQATHELLLPEVTRAVVGEMFGAIAERVGGVGGQIDGGGHGGAGFSLNGQSNWSDIVASQASALAAGDGNGVGGGGGIDLRDIDAKQLLRGLRFASPVSAGASHGKYGHAANLAFWGGGDYRDFGGEDGDDEWDGTVFSMRFGVDGAVRENLRAGLMLSYSDSETEYTRIENNTTTKGDYESELTAVSPYLRWQLGAGHAWASVSYGSGEVEVKPAGGDAATNDISMTGAAFGGGRKLLEQNGRELSLRADAFVANSEVDGDGDTTVAGIDDDLDVDANRLRVALAWSYPGRFAAGLLSPAFDLGLRHDGGDGRTGGGLELGGALRYRSADAGITAEVNARALLGHSGDHRGWGIGGLMRVQNGADGQGLAVSVAPNYGGMAGDGDSQLWGRGLAAAGRSIAKPAARLDAEVGYGVPMTVSGDSGLGRMFGFDAGGGDGMLTPYSALRFGDSARDYRLGMKWRAARLDLDVFARHADGGANDNSVAIEGRLKF